MRTAILFPIAAAMALTLSGCGKKAQNETAEAAESIPGDSNAMGEAVSDVNAAEAAMDNGAAIDADSSTDTGNAADDDSADGSGDGNQIYD